jgi:hypothetical protein
VMVEDFRQDGTFDVPKSQRGRRVNVQSGRSKWHKLVMEDEDLMVRLDADNGEW